MPTPSRIRRTPDFGRLRDAMSGPGADPRSWVALARVDDDPDAIRWEPGTGWIVDVTITSGQLSQETEIPCRVASTFGGAGLMRTEPQLRGCEVLLFIPDGDPNVSPVVFGVLHNPADCAVPTEVNGQTVDEAYALANHILKTDKNTVDDVGGTVDIVAEGAIKIRVRGSARVTLVADGADVVIEAATQVRLGDATATAPLEGVVNGQGIDPFTGLLYSALGNASTRVAAKR